MMLKFRCVLCKVIITGKKEEIEQLQKDHMDSKHYEIEYTVEKEVKK